MKCDVGYDLRTIRYDTIRYIEEFNVDSKALCNQFNLTHAARNKSIKKKLKQGNANAHLVQYS